MFARILSWFVFSVLITIDIVLSLVIVIAFYIPWVALKAIVFAVVSKVRPKSADENKPEDSRSGSAPAQGNG
ncbi:MAG: hypothetical protein QF412_05035 [Planctomycetota bacterium]|nr:hypothetical protein [Planctomycetota bacterium]